MGLLLFGESELQICLLLIWIDPYIFERLRPSGVGVALSEFRDVDPYPGSGTWDQLVSPQWKNRKKEIKPKKI